MKKISISWLGHASVSVQFNKDIIYFDPWIDENPACSLKVSDIEEATVVCVTHGHIDHLGDSIEIVKKTGATFICTPEIASYADLKGLKEGENMYVLNVGGSWKGNEITITMVSAVHTSEIQGDGWVNGPIQPGSGAVGYVLTVNSVDNAIYFSGDTGVTTDMTIIRDLYQPKVAIVSVGGKFNMGYREAAYAASLLLPDYFIPIHYGAFPDQHLDLDKLEREIKMRSPGVKLKKMREGESFEIPVP